MDIRTITRRDAGANFLIRASENLRMPANVQPWLENGPFTTPEGACLSFGPALIVSRLPFPSRSHRPGVYRSSECLWMASTV